MKRQVLLLAAVLVLASGCSLLPGLTSDNLNGTAWNLVSYDGIALIPNSSMTAFFEEGEISGSASCNLYFAAYQVKGDQITIEGLGWTEMACMDPEGIMQQEQQIMSLLADSSSFNLSSTRLSITTTKGEILVFDQLPPAE
jgi:heat shock protein HslJ